jgi:hypothetical protein
VLSVIAPPTGGMTASVSNHRRDLIQRHDRANPKVDIKDTHKVDINPARTGGGMAELRRY